MAKVKFSKIIENYNLKNYIPEIDTNKIMITIPEVNRPALQLAGFFNHFDKERVQIIGNVEWAYISEMTHEKRIEMYNMLMTSGIPCLVICQGIEPDEDLIEVGRKNGVPVLSTDMTTSSFYADLTRWLNVELAPCISIHGVLVDVYGEGVLIMGESGIGKSEAALELIKRGHRLVTDDVVEIRKVSEETLIGTSPDITKHFIELRGIGIIDVKTLFGVENVKDTQNIDMVIKLEEWNREKEKLELLKEIIEEEKQIMKVKNINFTQKQILKMYPNTIYYVKNSNGGLLAGCIELEEAKRYAEEYKTEYMKDKLNNKVGVYVFDKEGKNLYVAKGIENDIKKEDTEEFE